MQDFSSLINHGLKKSFYIKSNFLIRKNKLAKMAIIIWTKINKAAYEASYYFILYFIKQIVISLFSKKFLFSEIWKKILSWVNYYFCHNNYTLKMKP